MDNISSHLLAYLRRALQIEHFITTQSIPTEWKRSDVIPVHKKSSKSEKSNYRPVSILTSFPAVFEKTIFDQMYTKIAPLLSQYFFGFLKGHFCSSALSKVTGGLGTSLDAKDCCCYLSQQSIS